MFGGLRKRFKDVSSDPPLEIGARGLLTIATRGKDGPGEVQVELNGASTTFVAYSDEPLERGTQVVVYDTFGGRRVNVADQESAQAQQESQRKQAEYQRDTIVLKAKTKGEEAKAEAEAAQAGPLAEAEAQKAVTKSQTELARSKADLRQQQLQSEVVKPAEAQAEKTKIEAAAEADATLVRAEAAASNERVSLDVRLIKQLPEIVERASKGLANANITMIDGADGLARASASLIAQGRALFEAARGSSFDAPANGSKPQATAAASGAMPPVAPCRRWRPRRRCRMGGRRPRRTRAPTLSRAPEAGALALAPIEPHATAVAWACSRAESWSVDQNLVKSGQN